MARRKARKVEGLRLHLPLPSPVPPVPSLLPPRSLLPLAAHCSYDNTTQEGKGGKVQHPQTAVNAGR